MAGLLRKIVVFLSLIAFLLSSIIGLAGGLNVTTIIYRSLIVFAIFAAIGMALVPVFIKMWGENAPVTEEFNMASEEEQPPESETT